MRADGDEAGAAAGRDEGSRTEPSGPSAAAATQPRTPSVAPRKTVDPDDFDAPFTRLQSRSVHKRGTRRSVITRVAVTYRLRFDLEADGSRTRIPAGSAVVILPLSPREGDGYIWSEIYDSGQVPIDPAPGVDGILTCMKSNSQTVRRVLGSGAELSPTLAKTKPTLR